MPSVALEGIQVLDLSRVLAGPYCTMMLGDLGAEIIKVEPPGGDDTRTWGPPFVNGESTYFLSINRNKRSICLDLKNPAGGEVLKRLIAKADVLVQNFRPGTMERLGFGYSQVAEINPSIIYTSISGFGTEGPLRDKPGYDLLAQALGGMMAVTGLEGSGPVKAGMSIADIGAGMFASFSILAALRHRDRTGEGQRVETSLFETMLSWHTYLATAFFATGVPPRPLGSAHPSIVPYQAIRSADGYVIVAVGNESLWKDFCAATGLEHLTYDDRFRTNAERVARRDELIGLIEERFSHEPARYWMEVLEAAEVPSGPIQNLDAIYADPHTLYRGMVTEVEHPRAGTVRMTSTPLKLSATPGAVFRPPPLLGEHTDEVLKEHGYGREEIKSLRSQGAVS